MSKTKLLPLILAPVLAVACVQEQSVHPIQDALPTADQVAVKLPERAAATIAIGQLADYYVLTRQTTRTFNGVTAWVLVLVHAIVQHPATTVEGDVYTWGPWSEALDPADYRLIVVDLGDGGYDWQLDGRSKTEPGAEFLTVISGHAEPSDPIGDGRGDFVVDFDAAEAVNPVDNEVATGTASFVYDLSDRDGLVATVGIHAEGLGEVGQPASFDYAYAEAEDGSGTFEFGIVADMDDDGSAAEDVVINSRWLGDGAGRGDAVLRGGDLGDLEVTASECWDTSFRRTFYTDSVDFAPTEGDATACAFAEASSPAMP